MPRKLICYPGGKPGGHNLVFASLYSFFTSCEEILKDKVGKMMKVLLEGVFRLLLLKWRDLSNGSMPIIYNIENILCYVFF